MNENKPKAAITVSEMCSLLAMSRSQVYLHIKRGTFHAPLRLPNGRPYFNASQVEDNLKAKELGIGVNGQYVLFYARSEEVADTDKSSVSKHDCNDLMDGLQSLGLNGLTIKQVTDAVAVCYPMGVAGQGENDILRAVFKHLKRANPA